MKKVYRLVIDWEYEEDQTLLVQADQIVDEAWGILDPDCDGQEDCAIWWSMEGRDVTEEYLMLEQGWKKDEIDGFFDTIKFKDYPRS